MAVTTTNNKLTIPNFFKDFKITCEDEREYAGEVFDYLPWARDAVFDMFEMYDVIFVNDIMELCHCDAQIDAACVYLWNLAERYDTGDSTYLGEWVGLKARAEEAEAEYMACAM